MKTLENEKDKVNRICEVLRKETLEPAEREAINIIEDAKKQAAELILTAESQAKEMIQNAESLIAKEKKVFYSSLTHGSKQAIEMLRQEMEQKLFNPKLDALISNQVSEPNVIAQIIDALIHAIKKEGLTGDLIAYIPKQIKADDVNHLLHSEIVNQLKDGTVSPGNFIGGAQIKLINKNMTLDMSDQALKELLAGFIRPDFRKYFFNA